MISLLFSFLVLSLQSKIYHNCTSYEVNFANESDYLVDYEISCPNQKQRINLSNSKNIKTILIDEQTKSVSFKCDQHQNLESIIIYGEPDVYFESSCTFEKFEIHGFPFFHKIVGSSLKVNQIIVYKNPNFYFPFEHDSIQYINDENNEKDRNNLNKKNVKFFSKKNPKATNNICIGDDQDFADTYCEGNLVNSERYTFPKLGSTQLFIKFSVPKTVQIDFINQFEYTSIYVSADSDSSEISIILKSENPLKFSDTIMFENVDVTYELSNQNSPAISSEYLKLYNSKFKSSDNELFIASNKIILKESEISLFTFVASKSYFYFMSNVHQEIKIDTLPSEIESLVFVNATVVCVSNTPIDLKNKELSISNSKISSNLVFSYTTPDCNISFDDNSEICIGSISDGYNLILKNSKLLQPPNNWNNGESPLINIQHLQILNNDVESDFSNIDFNFKITKKQFDSNITVYAEKTVTLNVLSIAESTIPANFKITNCILKTDENLIAYSYRAFELDGSKIPNLKQMWSQGQITIIRFDNIDETPEINLRYDYDTTNGLGEIHLSNVHITLQTSPALEYISLENNAKIFGEKAKTNRMSLPYLIFLEYTTLILSNFYTIDIKGDIVMIFRDNDVTISAETKSIVVDSSKENSLFHNLMYTTDYGDVNFINESSKSYNFQKIFYSMNKGIFGNLEFDKFTNIVDTDIEDINWKFKGITIHEGIVPFSKIVITEPITHFSSDNEKTTFKFKKIIMQSREISINTGIYTESLYANGILIHFTSTGSVFEVNHAFVDPVTATFETDEVTSRKLTSEKDENKCIKSSKNNIMIINHLNVNSGITKNLLKFKGLIQVKSVYYDSDNSRINELPSIYGNDCFDKKQIYLKHSLVNDTENYFFGSECILSLEDENDILTDAELLFEPAKVDGKEIRIMCIANDTKMAEMNFADTILYLPNEEIDAKIITISMAQFILIGIGILIVIILMIVIVVSIICFRHSRGTLVNKKVE